MKLGERVGHGAVGREEDEDGSDSEKEEDEDGSDSEDESEIEGE